MKLRGSICKTSKSNANRQSLGTGLSSKNAQDALKCTWEYVAFLLLVITRDQLIKSNLLMVLKSNV